MLNENGILFGTTNRGGLSHKGTIYSISTSGAHTVIHRLRGGSDGENPDAGLLDVNGTLYGTTEYGGKGGSGTVFSITPSGTEVVLYSFKGFYSADGTRPGDGLLNVNGTLYGTAQFGGSGTTSGKETILHSFDGSHGYRPYAGLINFNGTLYGTTLGNTIPYPGTIFKISTSGKEHTFYYFKGAPSDGAFPYAGLTNVNGTFYGTTGMNEPLTYQVA